VRRQTWVVVTALLLASTLWLAPVAAAATPTTLVTLNETTQGFVFPAQGVTIDASSPSRIQLSLSNGGLFDHLDMRVAAGQTFQPGDYPFTQGTAAAMPAFSLTGDFALLCQTYSGTFTILEAAFDPGGAPTAFAASYTETCTNGTPYTENGQIRITSSVPVQALSITVVGIPDTPVGADGNGSLTLDNVGTDDVVIGAASLRGADAAEFRIASTTCVSGPLAPGASCTFNLAFHPTAEGGIGANLAFADSSLAGTRVIAVGGNGYAGLAPNDEIANASTIDRVPYTSIIDLTNATRAASDPACVPARPVPAPTATVWYRYTPSLPRPQTLRIDTDGYYSAVCIYTGSPGHLTYYGGTVANSHAPAFFAARGGTTYWIMARRNHSALDPDNVLRMHVRAAAANTIVQFDPGFWGGDAALPSVDHGILAWTQLLPGRTSTVGITAAGHNDRQIAKHGRDLYSVGFDSGRLLLQVADHKGHSDLSLLDVRANRFLRVPKALRTKQWEFGGGESLSGKTAIIVHGGTDEARQSLALVNLATGRSSTLARRRTKHQPSIDTPAIDGEWAAWSRGSGRVYRRNLARRTTTAAPAGRGFDHAPALADEGTLYFTRSTKSCGGATVMRWRPGGRIEALFTIAPGYDIANTDVDVQSGIIWLWFDRYNCKRGNTWIWRAAVDTAS
jgi:hypothetical protein